MVVEHLARRAEGRRLTVQEVRDALIAWCAVRAEGQIRRAMAFTSPEATDAEVRRLARQRARAFFERIASPFEEPTWADLRRVQARMRTWLLPCRAERHAVHREAALWERLLVGRAWT